MDPFLAGFLVGAFLTVAVTMAVRASRRRRVPPARADPSAVYGFATELMGYYEYTAHPGDLLDHPSFERGVECLGSGYSVQELLSYYRGDNAIIACMALEALARRRRAVDTQGVEELLAHISSVAAWTRFFVLRVLRICVPTDEPVIGWLLLQIDPSWTERHSSGFLKEFVHDRLSAGEVPTFGDRLEGIPEDQAEFLSRLLGDLGEGLEETLVAELQGWRRARIDVGFLRSIGRVWESTAEHDDEEVIEHPELLTHVSVLESALHKSRPQSVLLVGEPGVGKSAIVRALGRKLLQQGWVVFEAGYTELIAGQIYVGGLEGRLQELVRHIGGKRRLLWYVPEFHSLQWAGRHQHSPVSALDSLLPHIEAASITLLGETQSAAYEKLVQSKPRCLSAFETHRVQPLSEKATLELAGEWVGRHASAGDPPLIARETLLEAWNLAQQYLADKETPGNLLQLLNLTRRRLLTADTPALRRISVDDLIVTLTQLTGLPQSILDERHNLDLEALRQLFARRVLGQPEAVDCLVERVAMIKAGVTDPTRPQGVFLFAGPTGTGKTEIAKTLAEFLFGSSERMIRMDMSELQTPETLNRLLGGFDDTDTGSLADRI
ncbi:MAG: AAA family ATPase, partial [Candidatus Krumholzibacteriia bacterium]